MARILVTGAAGFIGSHTVELLLEKGHTVLGVDNFRTGRPENLTNALLIPAFSLREADIAQDSTLDKLAAEFLPDTIIHLAGLIGVRESIADPPGNYRLNIHGTYLAAEAARKFNVRRVVFASTAAIYGDVPILPILESVRKSPISPYAAAKLACEELLRGYGASFGFVVRSLRYFNVYGPRQDPNSPYSGVITLFANAFSSGRPPQIYGSGLQTRDFISVEDVANANLLAATAPNLESGENNICTGREVSINELLAALAKAFQAFPAPIYKPAQVGDILRSCGCPKAAREEFGFNASISLEDGVERLSASLRTRQSS